MAALFSATTRIGREPIGEYSRNVVREGEASTMFKVGPFVFDQKPDHRSPQPQRGIKVFRPVAAQFLSPRCTGLGVHLTSVSGSHHCGKERRRLHRLSRIEFVEFELEVLGHELAYEDRTPEQGARLYSCTQKGRDVQGTLDNSLAWFSGIWMLDEGAADSTASLTSMRHSSDESFSLSSTSRSTA